MKDSPWGDRNYWLRVDAAFAADRRTDAHTSPGILMLRLVSLAAGALLLLGAPAMAVSPFPLVCTNEGDDTQWVIDGQTITQDSPYAATSVGVLVGHRESYSRILNQSLKATESGRAP